MEEYEALLEEEYIAEGKRRYEIYQAFQPADSVWHKRNYKEGNGNGFFRDIGKIPPEKWDNYVLIASIKRTQGTE